MTKKILVAIPCVTGPDHVFESLNSVVKKENVDVFIIDNGATEEVKEKIRYFSFLPNVIVHGNPENVYVNPAWNQAMKFFLDNKEYDYLILMNSDLTMHKDWVDKINYCFNEFPEYSFIPKMSKDKNDLNKGVSLMHDFTIVHNGTPGVFITLSRKQATWCYPIPEDIKVWFGDNWIYDIIRTFSKTVIPDGLISYHHWSQTVNAVKGVHEVIEQDKIAWEKIVLPLLHKRIESIKTVLN
jgi:hypothetical protein